MKTMMLLMAQYSVTVVPITRVQQDFFPHLTVENLLRKTALGEIRLPIVRIEGSQKSAKGVHLQDLAEYVDKRREAAVKELEQMIS